ncbi:MULTISPECIES: hypothetical protein [unclassified Paraburkholderia]|uniref:hypothetical protein n=1 Tax=unclassified Paraburkholderia TaxID=2615204 RepID=UPI002AB1DD03|nr:MULTISPECIES: hypothetical protein [unclassified Paraburkholderia]
MDILLAFDKKPGCGLDCPSARSTVAIYSGILTVLAFPVLSYLLLRQGKDGFRRASVVLAAMIVIALLGAGTHYVIELHEQYRAAETARPVVADFDFMYMAIATRDVQTYTKAEESKPKAASVIPQWQRCVIDGASCDRQTVQAHMRCKAGVVYVNQADWQAFALIPRENLRGAVAMKSMNLCAPDNTPDE